MPIEGFELQADGPQSGLLWITFKNIHIHGKRGTPEYEDGCKQKAAIVDRAIMTELRLGTKHYDPKGNLLKNHTSILLCYAQNGGYFVDMSNRPKWKLDELIKNEGIVKHDNRAADHN